jgi:hypothetical protein
VTMGRTRRVTLREAAEVLGVSKEAVRKRVARGTLPSDVGGDGRRYVYLDAVGGEEHARDHDLHDDPRDELISQLRGEVEAWRDESRRKDTIIMNMTEAMKAIAPPSSAAQEEPPQEPSEAPQTATEQPGRVEEPQAPIESAQTSSEPRPATGGSQARTSRPSWRSTLRTVRGLFGR